MMARKDSPDQQSFLRDLGMGAGTTEIEAHPTRRGRAAPISGARMVPVDRILPDPDQPRRDVGGTDIAGLAGSIGALGILNPLAVRLGAGADGPIYHLIAGERRLLAARVLALAEVPVIVMDGDDEHHRRLVQLAENIQRCDLPMIDEARALRRLMDLTQTSARGVAAAINKSHTYVCDRLVLIEDDDVARAVGDGRITPTAGIAIAREPDAGARRALLERACSERITAGQVRTARLAIPAYLADRPDGGLFNGDTPPENGMPAGSRPRPADHGQDRARQAEERPRDQVLSAASPEAARERTAPPGEGDVAPARALGGIIARIGEIHLVLALLRRARERGVGLDGIIGELERAADERGLVGDPTPEPSYGAPTPMEPPGIREQREEHPCEAS